MGPSAPPSPRMSTRRGGRFAAVRSVRPATDVCNNRSFYGSQLSHRFKPFACQRRLDAPTSWRERQADEWRYSDEIRCNKPARAPHSVLSQFACPRLTPVVVRRLRSPSLGAPTIPDSCGRRGEGAYVSFQRNRYRCIVGIRSDDSGLFTSMP